ncbi:hypothetical protein PoB_004429300 [Plakobranchus ocellatus]|uniref:Uncharacterized protein n=1 Tax=Plakobranchus ocellatus TaxID=259542 RepID=A0AAV4BG11_9GAST|nr:hypothetical protein PoB_004429300 [Plakobranchus ocellatus]
MELPNEDNYGNTEARSERFSISLLHAGEEGIVLRRRTVVRSLGDAKIVPSNMICKYHHVVSRHHQSYTSRKNHSNPFSLKACCQMISPTKRKQLFLLKNLVMFSWTHLHSRYTNEVKDKILCF